MTDRYALLKFSQTGPSMMKGTIMSNPLVLCGYLKRLKTFCLVTYFYMVCKTIGYLQSAVFGAGIKWITARIGQIPQTAKQQGYHQTFGKGASKPTGSLDCPTKAKIG